MPSWPISTPRLNEKSDQPSASRGRPNSRSTLAKPKPCTSPNTSATQARRSRPSPRTRLSAPTNTMLSAMAGSMMLAGGVTRLSAASDSVMLWPMVKNDTIFSSAVQRPPSSSRPTRNRMWSGPIRMWCTPDGGERAHHRQRALRGARVVDVLLAVGVEDQLLLQLAVLVDVDERLVQRVVGKEVGVDRQRARGSRWGCGT